MPSGSEPAEGKGYASIFRDNRFEAWIPEHRKSYSQLHLQTISGGKSLHRYSSRYLAMGKSSPTLSTTRTQLVQLGTSQLPANREGAPSLPKAYTPVFLRTHACSHTENRGSAPAAVAHRTVEIRRSSWSLQFGIRESGPDLAPAVWSTVTILRVQCPPSGVAAFLEVHRQDGASCHRMKGASSGTNADTCRGTRRGVWSATGRPTGTEAL